MVMRKADWQRMLGYGLGALVLLSLGFFEMFNYSTTAFALRDILGDLAFLGVPWATWLAVAFCGIDFAGLARLFAYPEDEDPTELWYLFGAWFLAATMNAGLTWWGVSVALMEHTPVGTRLIGRAALQTWVPIFVALLVWLTRILLIGTVVMAGPRLFRWAIGRPPRLVVQSRSAQASVQPAPSPVKSAPAPRASVPEPRAAVRETVPQEPVYEPLQAQGQNRGAGWKV